MAHAPIPSMMLGAHGEDLLWTICNNATLCVRQVLDNLKSGHQDCGLQCTSSCLVLI